MLLIATAQYNAFTAQMFRQEPFSAQTLNCQTADGSHFSGAIIATAINSIPYRLSAPPRSLYIWCEIGRGV